MSPSHIPTAVAPTVRPAVDSSDSTSLTGQWWEQAEILLVADRQQGSTHHFFGDWRFEVVTGPDQEVPGRCLFASPISQQTLTSSGWRYTLVRLPNRPGFETLDTAAFSWTVNKSAQTQDPFAAASEEAHAWLAQSHN
jgi:hypothetical protein